LIIGLLVCSLEGPAQGAPPAEVHVDAFDDYFLPSLVTVARAGTVVWDFTGLRTHTATDDSGLGLYDSGLVSPGGPSFSFTFPSAGTYRFACTLHDGMDGRISVSMHAAPAEGPITRTFNVRWSKTDAPPGFVFDVRIRVKAGAWQPWQDDVTFASIVFHPEAVGKVRFSARLRSLSSGAASEWSQPVPIRVREA
jgi:plastocyanin